LAVVVGFTALSGSDAIASSTKSKATVAALKVKGVGKVLVDSDRMTLYTLTNGGQAIACTGQCATLWPPLTVTAGSQPKVAKGVKAIGTTSTGNQVTSGGLPLYRYSGDSKSGQANGDGLTTFGGVWHVVSPSGAAPSASGSGSASSGSSSGTNNGY
jgi:predicted lipoprotein with Yx(FWY)xxD motif